MVCNTAATIQLTSYAVGCIEEHVEIKGLVGESYVSFKGFVAELQEDVTLQPQSVQKPLPAKIDHDDGVKLEIITIPESAFSKSTISMIPKVR
ncbi:hypothetical protein GQX74_005798 [Glossina fuscipes]|nr:hypothetical protein GQX74_005798 [Glossina fuscipes]